MAKKEFVLDIEVEDDVGQKFPATASFTVDELRQVVSKHGYKLVKK